MKSTMAGQSLLRRGGQHRAVPQRGDQRFHEGSDIARAEGLHPSVPNELMRLTLLAPDIIELLMSGRQPRRMSLIWFQRNPVPVNWVAQRQIVQRFEEDV